MSGGSIPAVAKVEGFLTKRHARAMSRAPLFYAVLSFKYIAIPLGLALLVSYNSSGGPIGYTVSLALVATVLNLGADLAQQAHSERLASIRAACELYAYYRTQSPVRYLELVRLGEEEIVKQGISK